MKALIHSNLLLKTLHLAVTGFYSRANFRHEKVLHQLKTII